MVNNHLDLFPKKYNRYIEPFLGSGASFFALAPKKAILADVNKDLINFYEVLKSHWEELENLIEHYHKKHSKDFYYLIREKSFEDPIKKAAQFLYLNRTCWNGLYRVNLKGVFNVPIGTKTSVKLDTDNFEGISKLLRNVELKVSDFELIIDQAQEGDFVFADPPYTVKHNMNGFVKYNENLFKWEDQIRLRDCLVRAKGRGVSILLTNADHQSVKNLFSKEFILVPKQRASVIAGNKSSRNPVSELIIIS